jgi:hypothetical protein
MNVTTAKTVEDSLSLLERLNYLHDGAIRKICFSKKRSINEADGSLVYPFDNMADFIKCNIEMELLHNSYDGAKKTQILTVSFCDTTSFNFAQDDSYDYSDIYEAKCVSGEAGNMTFYFYSSEEKVESLAITCSEFVCEEL